MRKYNKEVIKILKNSEIEAINLKHNYVGTEHMILSLLKTKNELSNIFKEINLSYEQFKKEVKKLKPKNNKNTLTYTPLLKRIIIESSYENEITTKNILINLIETSEGIAISILNSLQINIKKLYKLLKNDNYISRYGENLNQKVKNNNFENITGRESELKEIIEVLSRKNKNNPILIGEAGVGKTAIIEALAYRINNKKVPNELTNTQIISINMANILSGTKYRGEFEEKLQNIISEFEENENLILFIDEIHTLVGAGGAEGAIDASNILKPYLARNRIKCIGATTINEYNKSIAKDKALNRRFQIIKIKEPNKKETINILKNSKKYFEKYHNVQINNKQIELIVNLSEKYIKNKYEPDKSLDILDKACTKIKIKNISLNSEKIINNLLTKRKEYIKNNNFEKAKELKKELLTFENKSNQKTKLDNKTIMECYNIIKNNFGFNIK